jgi:hypothetical protein
MIPVRTGSELLMQSKFLRWLKFIQKTPTKMYKAQLEFELKSILGRMAELTKWNNTTPEDMMLNEEKTLLRFYARSIKGVIDSMDAYYKHK